MRKLLLSIAALLFMAGLTVAAEAIFVKFDKEKKEITVKEGDKTNTYKVGDKVDADKLGKRKEGDKIDITVDKGTVTVIKGVKK